MKGEREKRRFFFLQDPPRLESDVPSIAVNEARIFFNHEPYSTVGVKNASKQTYRTACAKNFDTFTSILRHAGEGNKLKPDCTHDQCARQMS